MVAVARRQNHSSWFNYSSATTERCNLTLFLVLHHGCCSVVFVFFFSRAVGVGELPPPTFKFPPKQ